MIRWDAIARCTQVLTRHKSHDHMICLTSWWSWPQRRSHIGGRHQINLNSLAPFTIVAHVQMSRIGGVWHGLFFFYNCGPCAHVPNRRCLTQRSGNWPDRWLIFHFRCEENLVTWSDLAVHSKRPIWRDLTRQFTQIGRSRIKDSKISSFSSCFGNFLDWQHWPRQTQNQITWFFLVFWLFNDCAAWLFMSVEAQNEIIDHDQIGPSEWTAKSDHVTRCFSTPQPSIGTFPDPRVKHLRFGTSAHGPQSYAHGPQL
jgi:hypothetical protein